MEFQYNSINRGGHSIYETVARAGYNPMEYIRFYNLRNYDRINTSAAMAQAEKISGVSYEDARKQYDATHGGGFGNDGSSQNRGIEESQSRDLYPGQPQYQPGQQPTYQTDQSQYQPYRPPGSQPPPQQTAPIELPTGEYGQPQTFPPRPQGTQSGYGEQPQYTGTDPYGKYQEAAQQVGGPLGSGRWDTVSECYMLNGEDIRNVPWEGGNVPEIDAFVTEELYIHSKVSCPSHVYTKNPY